MKSLNGFVVGLEKQAKLLFPHTMQCRVYSVDCTDPTPGPAVCYELFMTIDGQLIRVESSV